MRRSFAGYQLRRRIGRGGMGEVWLAERVTVAGAKKRLALKLVELRSAPARRRFASEARNSLAMNDPHIVQSFDAGFERGFGYLAMEYVDGCDLSVLVARLRERGERLPLCVVVHVVRGVLRGIRHAHSAKLLHRDVSAHNVLLGRNGAVKLADFGVAIALDSAGRAGMAGKPTYLAPEVAAGHVPSTAADVYGVGVILRDLCPAAAERASQYDALGGLQGAMLDPAPERRVGVREAIATLDRLDATDATASVAEAVYGCNVTAGEVSSETTHTATRRPTSPPSDRTLRSPRMLRLLWSLFQSSKMKAAAAEASVGESCVACDSKEVTLLAPAAYRCNECGHEGGDGLGAYALGRRRAAIEQMAPEEKRASAHKDLVDARRLLLSAIGDVEQARSLSTLDMVGVGSMGYGGVDGEGHEKHRAMTAAVGLMLEAKQHAVEAEMKLGTSLGQVAQYAGGGASDTEAALDLHLDNLFTDIMVHQRIDQALEQARMMLSTVEIVLTREFGGFPS